MINLNEQLLARLNQVILGKPHELRLALCCLLARGHLLIEDLPGMGKTTLAHALATLLGLSYQRVQFTSDLLPADLLGLSIFDAQSQSFSFHPGPLFSQVLLADEINRGSPRTQSALLEAMAERQISIDGVTRPLPEPFFVIATQNPQDQAGTFPLPESQLDRFLMRIELGYPSKEAELRHHVERRQAAFQSGETLLGLGIAFPAVRFELYLAATLVASVGSHMSSSWRHFSLLHRTVLRQD